MNKTHVLTIEEYKEWLVDMAIGQTTDVFGLRSLTSKQLHEAFEKVEKKVKK